MDIYHPIKTCSKCGIDKPLFEFSKRKDSPDGYYNQCKSCRKLSSKSYLDQYRIDNKDRLTEQKQLYYLNNIDRIKETQNKYYKENIDKCKQNRKQYYINNKDKSREYQRRYYNRRISEDSVYKLRFNVKCLIINSIKKKGFKKNTKTADIIGCDWVTLQEHLESQFDSNMSWNNHGTYWDIDHIIPLASAKTEEDIIKLNHYTNLQPLESYYNRHIKRDKL